MRSRIRSAGAAGLAALLLAAGCGREEAPEKGAAAARARGARELALLHERQARREARMAGREVEHDPGEAPTDPAEMRRLEQQLARQMTGGETPEPQPEKEPGARRFEPGTFPQLQEPDPERRADAVFEADPDDDVEMLVLAIQDESPDVREAAAEQLGDSENDLALDALIGGLQDPDEDVVMAVIEALEWRDDKRAVPALRWALEERDDIDIRDAAQDAIDWLETD